MYSVSQDYIEAMHRPVQAHKLQGTIGEISFDESDILEGSFIIDNQCSDTTNVQIGQVYIAELKMTLIKSDRFSRYSFKGATVTPYFGLRLASGNYEFIPLGVFTICEASWGASGIEITAYDNMSKFDRSFSSSSLFGTPFELLSLACESCHVELGMLKSEFSEFVNGEEKLSLYPDNDIESWRDVLSWLAQSLGANALINRDGQLYFRFFNQDVVDSLNDRQRFTGASFGDYVTRYTGLSCVNIEAQTTSYYGETIDDGLTYNLGSNPFLQADGSITVEDLRRNILRALGMIEYVPFKVDMIGNPVYDLMDCFCFTGGLADEDKISCLTKYCFRFNDKYTAQGVGQNPALVSSKSKSDKKIAGLMATVESITSSINNLIYDYNTGPLLIHQEEETVAMLSFYIMQEADIEAHFLLEYTASTSSHLIIRFYDGNVEELYSPVEMDILEGEGSVGIPHSFLRREEGIHPVYVTLQCTLGEIHIKTRGVFFTIDGGNFASAVDEIPMDILDISMRQLLESNGPDEIWTVGIENETLLVSKRPYSVMAGNRIEWTPVYSPGKAKTAAIEFDGQWVLKSNADKYTIETEDQPWYFWVDMEDRLIGQHGDNEELRLILDEDVSKVSACRGYSSILYPEQDQGLIVAYIKNGHAYYRPYIYDVDIEQKRWLAAVVLEDSEQWNDVRVHRLNDYRIAFTLSNDDHNLWLISERTYVGQSVYPELRNEHADPEWFGLSIVYEDQIYSGQARPFTVEGESQSRFYVDFPLDIKLFDKAKGASVNINGSVLATDQYELSTNEGELLLELDEAVGPQQYADTVVTLTMPAFSHYVEGNGIRYSFTDQLAYSWRIVRPIITVYAYEIENHNDSAAPSATFMAKPLVTIKNEQPEETRTDVVSTITVNSLIKPIITRTSDLGLEARTDSVGTITISFTITQSGETPI